MVLTRKVAMPAGRTAQIIKKTVRIHSTPTARAWVLYSHSCVKVDRVGNSQTMHLGVSVPTASTINFCRSCLQRLSPLFSSTSWKEGYNSFLFINIVESRKADIFSIFVFNNLMEFFLIFYPFFLRTTTNAKSCKYLSFNDIGLWLVFAIHC